MLLDSSSYLQTLMEILILHFCVIFNLIFKLIKPKLIFYLILLQKRIVLDYMLLLFDVVEFIELLSKLQSEIARYKLILDKVKKFLNKLKTLLSKKTILTTLVSVIEPFNKIVTTLFNKLESLCFFCNNLNGIFGLLNKELLSIVADSQGGSINLKVTIKDKSQQKKVASITNIDRSKITDFQNSVMSIKNILGISELADIEVSTRIIHIIEKLLILETLNKENSVVKVSPLMFDLTLINMFQKSIESIKKLLEILQMFDPIVSKEIMSIKEQLDVLEPTNKANSGVTVSPFSLHLKLIFKFNKFVDYIKKLFHIADIKVSTEIISILRQLLIVETINLVKLNLLITQIQLKYYIILIRSQLLACTILFYQEIKQTMAELFKLMEFDFSNVSEFLGKCSEVEKNISSLSKKIDEYITNLAQSYKTYESCGVSKELLKVYVQINNRIVKLKFYADLMALEILIFKNIIINLTVMTVSSSILDVLMSEIAGIRDIDKAVPTLIVADAYLRTFYTIQLENTLSIVGLSSALKFSQSIHGYYHVLLYNLQLINGLIWGLECYIHHLLVFKYTSLGLNSLIGYIGDQVQIITQIDSVVKAMFTITNKLKSIDKSIKQLKTVIDGTDITNWKESAKKMRHETQLISGDIEQINSEITKISGFVLSILTSWTKLVSLYYSLLVLISYVSKEVIKTNKPDQMSVTIGNQYYSMFIGSVMEPCNKQLKFILAYLVVMSVVMRSLIKFVQNTMLVIYGMMGWLSALTSKLQTDIENINKGVVDMECAIEGVARNFILCTINQVSTSLINHHNFPVVDVDRLLMNMYGVSNVMDYKMVVNSLFESAKKIDQILQLVPWYDFCQCILWFECFNTRIELGTLSVFKIIEQMTSKSKDELIKFLKIDEIKKLQGHEMDINHSCLCMITKYKLYPQMLKLINIISFELEVLGTISRKYDRYRISTKVSSDVIKMTIVYLELLENISIFMEPRYLWATSKITMIPNLICFCRAPGDKYYHLILNRILVITSLIENIWSMDTQSMRETIVCLSSLIRDFDMIDKDNNIGWNICKLFIYQIIINKYCSSNSDPPCDPKCCCVTCILIILMSVYICISYNINSKLCPKKCDLIKQRICCFLKLFCKYLGSQCCIKEILNKISTDLNNCNNKTQINCDQLISKCNELCNVAANGCKLECICNKVKQCLTELCKSFKGEIDKIVDCIDKCKDNGRKCCKCKIIGFMIIVMRNNMVLIECNMKHDIKFSSLTFGSITRIVLSNNIKSLYLCRNELGINLVKNNLITSSSYQILNSKNSIESRNWGYDTRY